MPAPSRYLVLTVILSMLAGVVGACATICAIVDATGHNLPDPMINAQVGATVLLAVSALLVHFTYRRSSPLKAVAQSQRELVEAVAELAREVEQLSARRAADDAAFEYGRRYEETANGRPAGPRLVRGSEN
jgi:hypothetical protein